jgi:DNA polymerase-4
MDRSIIHLNVADFAVAVERVIDRRLESYPVIIAPRGTARATVYDMSEEAYQTGVRKGMPLHTAGRLCRDARILPPHPDRYEQAMRALLRQALSYSPRVEAGEADGHLFMDVSGTSRLHGPPMDVAWRLRKHTRAALGLNPIWSVAANKLVAKVASRLVKPGGEYIVAAGEEKSFLAPLCLHLLPGLERDDLARLHELNLTRVRQAAALSLEQLQVSFGRRAMFVHEVIRGIDPSPVMPVGCRPPAVRVDHEFDSDTNHAATLEAGLYRLVERAGRRLRQKRHAARRMAVFLDYSDGIRCRRRTVVRPPTANDPALFEAARQALLAAWTRRVRIRHMRLVCDRLVFPPSQLELFPAERSRNDRRMALVDTIDRIRRRFGPDALRVGRAMVLQP